MVRVAARAVEGAANEAVITAVAEAFEARRREVRLVHGDRSRTKVIEIEGDEVRLSRRLDELLEI